MDKESNKSETIKVTNVALESYSFASKCLEYAKKAKENKEISSDMRMFARTSIIHSALSAEADLTRMIELSLKKSLRGRLNDDERDKQELMYEYLTNFQARKKSKYREVQFEINSIYKKYNYLRMINKLDSKQLPTEYAELTILRNKLVHYMNTYQPIAYSEDLIEKAAWALYFAREFIIHIRGISKQDPPTWAYKVTPSSEGYDYD